MMRQILTILGYVAATAIVVVGTILLIAYGNGYSYDFKTGRLIHQGLIILSSTPSGAKITLDGKGLRQKTPYRNTFEAGRYTFILTKDGYRTWQKQLEAIPSQATLAQYVILVPQHLQVDSVGNYPAISQFVSSRDHHRIAYVVPSGAGAGIWSMDAQSHQQTRIYSPAAASDSAPAETVQILSWADDNSHLMIKSQTGDKSSLVVIAASGTDQPINVSDTFKIDIADARFSTGDWHQLYWLSADGLRRIDLSNQSVSAVLADHVQTFALAGDRILYVDTSTSPASLWSLDRSGHKQKLVNALPASSTYEIAYTTYIGTPEAAVVAQDSRSTTLYSDIFNKPVRKSLATVGLHVGFNDDGRFLLQSDENHVTTYDLERDAIYPMPEPNNSVTNLSWFDDFHLLFTRGDEVVLSEYDGNYAIAITRGLNLAPVSSPDNKNVYAVATTSNGSASIKSVKIRQ